MPLNVSPSSPPTMPRRFSLNDAVGGIRLTSIDNRSIPRSAVCQASGTPGIYNRAANAHAMSIAVDLMKVARESMSGRSAEAMDKTLRLLSANTSEHFGNTVLVHLTTLGAMHAGITSRLESSPDNTSPQAESLRLSLARVEKAIVDIGIKAGTCRTVADGGYHGDSRSWELTKSLGAGREAILACINDGEGRQILERIADVLLAEPMMNSILERQGQENWEAFRDGACNPMEAVQKQMADDLERGLQRQLDSGGAYDFMSAILELMKLPEYVVQRDPGRHAPPAPERPVDGDPPPPRLPPELRDVMARGGPIAYNHNNVPVHNHVPVNVDLSGLANHINCGHAPPQLLNVENLIRQMLDDRYELGLTHGRLEAERRTNEQLRNENDSLRARVLETDARLRLFASRNGGDGVFSDVVSDLDRSRGNTELRGIRHNNRDVVPPPPGNLPHPEQQLRMADILTVQLETTEDIPQVPLDDAVATRVTTDGDERLDDPRPRGESDTVRRTQRVAQAAANAELLNLLGHYSDLGPGELPRLANLANYHGARRGAPDRDPNVDPRLPAGVTLHPAGPLPPFTAAHSANSAAAPLGRGVSSQPPVGSRQAASSHARSSTPPPVPPRVRNPIAAFSLPHTLPVIPSTSANGGGESEQLVSATGGSPWQSASQLNPPTSPSSRDDWFNKMPGQPPLIGLWSDPSSQVDPVMPRERPSMFPRVDIPSQLPFGSRVRSGSLSSDASDASTLAVLLRREANAINERKMKPQDADWLSVDNSSMGDINADFPEWAGYADGFQKDDTVDLQARVSAVSFPPAIVKTAQPNERQRNRRLGGPVQSSSFAIAQKLMEEFKRKDKLNVPPLSSGKAAMVAGPFGAFRHKAMGR